MKYGREVAFEIMMEYTCLKYVTGAQMRDNAECSCISRIAVTNYHKLPLGGLKQQKFSSVTVLEARSLKVGFQQGYSFSGPHRQNLFMPVS